MKHYREIDQELFLKALKYLKYNMNFKPKNILDIGCGDGSLTCKIKELFNEIYGIDYDTKFMEVCTKKGIKIS